MCLTLTVRAPADERDAFATAAARAQGPFRVVLAPARAHAPRWPWARPDDAAAATAATFAATISEDGGCACSQLADNADWNAEAWALRADVREPLARTLEALTAATSCAVVEALWVGDQPVRERAVTPAGLGALVRAGALGTRTRYVTTVAA